MNTVKPQIKGNSDFLLLCFFVFPKQTILSKLHAWAIKHASETGVYFSMTSIDFH